MPESKSLVSMPTGGPGAPSVAVLLAPLKELLESATLQHEALREMVAAVADAEKGKQGPLNAFLHQRTSVARPGSSDETDKLRAEVNALREENARLRERLKFVDGAGDSSSSTRRGTTGDEA